MARGPLSDVGQIALAFEHPDGLWHNKTTRRTARERTDGMLLQTNSYIVPKEKRTEHARLLRRFRQLLERLGCDHFEVYEQVGSNWSGGETTGRFVQIMRFRDRKQQLAIQAAERSDPHAQQLIQEFCQLINFPYQQQQGLFAVGFYTSVLPVAHRQRQAEIEEAPSEDAEPAPPAAAVPENLTPEAQPPEGESKAEDESEAGTEPEAEVLRSEDEPTR